jgi:hypothetical protein
VPSGAFAREFRTMRKCSAVSAGRQTSARREAKIAERSSPGVGGRDGTRLLGPHGGAA